jgi:hypothetical protein
MRNHRAIRAGLTLATTAALLIGASPRVSAHGGGDTSNKSADYVRQSIAYLVNMQSDAGMDMAEDKMHDAMNAPDHTGVDMDDIARAHDAYHAGSMDVCIAYLEASIGVQPQSSDIKAAAVAMDNMPAMGAEPGNVLIPQPLDGARDLSGASLAALVVSIVSIVAGALLALRTRRRHGGEA